MIFLALLALPTLILLFVFFVFKTINITEFIIQMGVQCIIAGVSVLICLNANTFATEIWNGVVTRKSAERVSCSHSYECNCTYSESCDSKGKNCHTDKHCQTCYEHDYDIDWNVYTSNQETFTIDRVDRQGLHQPQRFAQVIIGEPTATEHSYTNYIKAAPESLFRTTGYDNIAVPKYPEVFDYYRLNHVLGDLGNIPEIQKWQDDLNTLNGQIGAWKQANVYVVFTRQTKDFFNALQQKWLGGQKNDIVIVIGLSKAVNNIEWVNVMAWSKTKDVHIQLRDSISSIGFLERTKVLEAIKHDVIKYYDRKPMKDFEYLKASIVPTLTQWIVSIVFGVLVSIGLCIFFHKNEIEEFELFKRRY